MWINHFLIKKYEQSELFVTNLNFNYGLERKKTEGEKSTLNENNIRCNIQ